MLLESEEARGTYRKGPRILSSGSLAYMEAYPMATEDMLVRRYTPTSLAPGLRRARIGELSESLATLRIPVEG